MNPTIEMLEELGIEFQEKGTQLVTDCLHCGKESHVYFDRDRTVWDCKRCGAHGNGTTFLEKILDLSQENLANSTAAQKAARISRRLPTAAFTLSSVGYWMGIYTIPVRGVDGVLRDCRLWEVGKRVNSLSGAELWLWGSEKLTKDSQQTVYLCEGEWDGIATSYILHKAGSNAVAVAVPGSGTFKREWIPLFAEKDVLICYDNDEAGGKGERKVYRLLRGVARSIRCLHWPEEVSDGYDLRDMITSSLAEKIEPKDIVKLIGSLMADQPRMPLISGEAEAGKDEAPVEGISPAEGLREFEKYLLLRQRDIDAIIAVIGSYYANRVANREPIWLFLVGPSGACKSEILGALSGLKETVPVTSLTPRTLASGSFGPDGSDPSLLPQLDGKTMVVKDWTVIMQLPPMQLDEIMATLRDAWDGTFNKPYGNGIFRKFKTHFGIVAGVTPAIDSMGKEGPLGERFLRYWLDAHNPTEQMDVALRALGGATENDDRKAALQMVVKRMMAWQDRPSAPPSLSESQRRRIGTMAIAVSKLRAAVMHGRGSDREVLAMPTPETPTRLAIQLGKLAMGIGWFLGETEASERTMQIVTHVALSTPPRRRVLIAQAIATADRGITIPELVSCTRLPTTTITYMLEDLEIQGVAWRDRRVQPYCWNLEESLRSFLQEVSHQLPKLGPRKPPQSKQSKLMPKKAPKARLIVPPKGLPKGKTLVRRISK